MSLKRKDCRAYYRILQLFYLDKTLVDVINLHLFFKTGIFNRDTNNQARQEKIEKTQVVNFF